MIECVHRTHPGQQICTKVSKDTGRQKDESFTRSRSCDQNEVDI